MRRLLSIGLYILFFTTGSSANAQLGNLAGVAGGPAITLSPQFPAPGERVNVTLEDYSGLVGAATIAWSLDGVNLPEVSNLRSMSFVVGEALQTDTITATLTNNNGRSQVVSVTIEPRYLDIIIEPQTFTPVLYRGRALPIYGSLVRVSGVLSGKNGLVNPSSYTYNWKLNNRSIDGGARLGGFQTLYTVPHGRTHIVTLEVIDQAGLTVARRSVTVETSVVDVLLYEQSTLYGLSPRVAPSSFNMVGNSLTLRAIPYNLDLRALTGRLVTEWSIAGAKTNSGSDRFEITLDRRGAGTANLEFEVRNLSELLQGDKASMAIRF